MRVHSKTILHAPRSSIISTTESIEQYFGTSNEPDALRLVPQAVGGARRADAGEGLPSPIAAPSAVALVEMQPEPEPGRRAATRGEAD